MFDVPPLTLSIMMFWHLLIVLLLNQYFRIERLHANDSIMVQLGDNLQGGGLLGLLSLLHRLAATQGELELRLIEG
jgi:hypothetical protein